MCKHNPTLIPLSGFFDYESSMNWCLSCSMNIQKVKGKEVNLKNFALLEANQATDVYVNELNLETCLSAQEAFLLFSNICFEAKGFSVLRTEPYTNESFEKEALKLAINLHYKFRNDSYSYLHECFMLEYFPVSTSQKTFFKSRARGSPMCSAANLNAFSRFEVCLI